MMTVILAHDIWIYEGDDGKYYLSRPLVTNAKTGESMPGATVGWKVVLFEGQTLDVEVLMG